MAETDLTFNGTDLVNVINAAGRGFYMQVARTPNESEWRDISFYNTAFHIERLVGFGRTHATAEKIAFACMSREASWAAVSAKLALCAAFQQAGTIGQLVFATPTFSGTAEGLNNMKLDKIIPRPQATKQSLVDGTWLAVFTVHFVRMGAQS